MLQQPAPAPINPEIVRQAQFNHHLALLLVNAPEPPSGFAILDFMEAGQLEDVLVELVELYELENHPTESNFATSIAHAIVHVADRQLRNR